MGGGILAVLVCFTTTCYFFRIPDHMRTVGQVGFWGPPDAEINWCEQDYMVLSWVAEPVNVVTNIFFIALPASFLAVHETTRETTLIAVLVIVIGAGSMLYHGSLRYHMMLCDELPIFWYGLLSASSLLRRLRGLHLARLACFYASVVTLLIVGTGQQSKLHQGARGVMACSFAAALVLMAWGFPALVRRLKADLAGGKCRKVPQLLERMLDAVFLMFVASVICWLLDNWYCSALQSLPWGVPYPQLHAWWHILVAPAVHFALVILHVDDNRASPHLAVSFRYALPTVWL